MFEVEVLNSELYIRGMLLGPEQGLYRCPSYEAACSQCRYGRWVKVTTGGLQTMLATNCLIDVGDGGMRYFHEEC